MIVLAFANGDRRALKDLLSREVYDSFDAAISDREKHEQKTETRFVSIDKAEIVGAEARDRAAQLTVRFVSQMISVTRDKAGTVVDGNADKVADITDVWTFARDTGRAIRTGSWLAPEAVSVLTFVSCCSERFYECQNQRGASKYRILVRCWIWHSLWIFAVILKRMSNPPH